MKEIKKKTWPEYFEKVLKGEKKFELRLADFDIKNGDILILEEYNPETKQYTGRTLKKKFEKAKNLSKRGMNYSEMAKELNVSPTTIKHWIKGKEHLPRYLDLDIGGIINE